MSDSQPNVSLLVLGARGSIPVSGAEFLTFGGSTTCLAIVEGGRVRGFIDAGTGLLSFRARGLELAKSVPIFLTHYHWDHIQGVSMLGEVWQGACLFTVYGFGDPEPKLIDAIRPPWFPVALDEAPEPMEFETMIGSVGAGSVTVTHFDVQHPQGAIGYRLDGPNRSLAIVTDHESAPDCDDVVAAAIDGVDVLIHDSQYLPAEAEKYVGWGHSTWENAVAMANRVGAKELILTSHEPSRTDAQVEEMVAAASESFPNVSAAGPGMEIRL